ncbi:phytanoyl-CoA dioxygenase family protein [Streptomyces sp. TS71-3]|uniref:phytanoyl-CoA dioxygenase family protein n=1 Tax=Streptomyces sp. TS71-3 TaxID=2733862 RepID=UPI001B178313|nr:phytanoyl-CoA dioxygenase family protein [Streptomyces sp. TS71-3]GHJ41663.1 hypothetical protein Sm713_72720 [Streptomyces sp. TS71-3]
MTTHPGPGQLLDSVRMATFAASGFLRLDAVVPQELNDQAVDALTDGIPAVPYGTPVSEAFPAGSFARKLVEVPAVAGALRSLVGPEPNVDHHAVHVREPGEGKAQPLHGDAIIDVRPDAFDVQLMYYPRAVTLEAGGTLIVPGSHLRRTNESDTGRYQNLLGQVRLVCEAGTVVLLHHGVWHGGRRNDGTERRYMFKIRFNPVVRQTLLWDTGDLDDPAVADALRVQYPWYEQATGRLELHNRIRMWRALTGDPGFDLDHWATRVSNRPGVPAAV